MENPTHGDYRRESTEYLNKMKEKDFDKYDEANAEAMVKDSYNLIKKNNPEMSDKDIYGYMSRFSLNEGNYGKSFEKKAKALYEKADNEEAIRQAVDNAGGNVEEAVDNLEAELIQQLPSDYTKKIRKGTETYLMDLANELVAAGDIEGAEKVRMLNRKFQDATPTTSKVGRVVKAVQAGVGTGTASLLNNMDWIAEKTGVGDEFLDNAAVDGNFDMGRALDIYGQQKEIAKSGTGALGSFVLAALGVGAEQLPTLLLGGTFGKGVGMALSGLQASGVTLNEAEKSGASTLEQLEAAALGAAWKL